MQKVSIIMPSFQCGPFIRESIQSVIAQSYRDWELLIVDDCSTDETQVVVAEMMALDSRIRYIRNERNMGAAYSRNLALRVASGRWIAFLDSDDLWASDKLERQVAFMEENGYSFTYHKYSVIDESGRPMGMVVGGKRCVSKWDMYACCWPGCLSVMYDRDKVGLIQIAEVRKNNDTAMWLKVVETASCYLLPANLASYRHRQGSITPPSIWGKIFAHYPLFRVAAGLNPFVATFWTLVNIFGSLYKKLFYVKRVMGKG